MAKKSDLLVLQEMASGNLDISSSTSFVGIQTVKAGGHLTMGISPEVAQRFAFDAMKEDRELIAVLYIVNKKQFFEIKNKEE